MNLSSCWVTMSHSCLVHRLIYHRVVPWRKPVRAGATAVQEHLSCGSKTLTADTFSGCGRVINPHANNQSVSPPLPMRDVAKGRKRSYIPRKSRIAGGSASKSVFRRSVDYVVDVARKRYSGKAGALNIARDVKVLARALNTEAKHLDGTFSATVTTSASLVQLFGSNIAQGSTDLTRTGDSVKVVGIDFTIQCIFGTGTTNLYSGQTFRCFLVRYKKTPRTSGQTAFNIAEFVDVFGASYSYQSLPNTDTNQNFDILWQDDIDVTNMLASATNNLRIVNKTVRLTPSFHQVYSGSAGSTITDNCLFFVCLAAVPNNTGGTSTVEVNYRQWYVDN